MDSTTLITFWLKAPSEIRTVELFGSWDNFSNGYRMQYDGYKGRGSWTCCPSFERIICDGDKPNWSRPRSGALKQGGRYWYFYKLNDDDEHCDPSQPSTTTCPLLPGQSVNVMDIPTEMMEPPQRVSSASAMADMLIPQMTQNPEDRYKKLTRRHPTKLPRFYCSTDALHEQVSPSIMESGGAVKRPAGPRPQRLNSAGNKNLRRVRPRDTNAEYQQPGSCFVRSTSGEMEALVQSIATTVPELDRLPQLRPFGPMPGYEADTRPSTRHGASSGGPPPAVGLGLSFSSAFSSYGFGSATLDNDDEDLTSSSSDEEPQQQQQQSQTLSQKPLQSPFAPENNNYSDRTDWPFAHPNPLKANPSQQSPPPFAPSPFPSTSHYYSPNNLLSESATSSILHSPISPLEENYHPRTSYGPDEMCSPTFTAATASTLEDQSITPGTDCFPLDFDDGYLDDAASSGKQDCAHGYDSFLGGQFPILQRGGAGAEEEEAQSFERTPRPDFGGLSAVKTNASSSCATVTPFGFAVVGESPEGGAGGDFAEAVFGALGIRV